MRAAPIRCDLDAQESQKSRGYRVLVPTEAERLSRRRAGTPEIHSCLHCTKRTPTPMRRNKSTRTTTGVGVTR